MIHSTLKFAAWLVLAAIIVVTVSPVGLRPDLGFGPEIDRLVGFFVLGAAFSIAYPRRRPVLLILLVFGAFAIESLQLFEPDRHARIVDASVKAAGSVAGVGFAWLLLLTCVGLRQRPDADAAPATRAAASRDARHIGATGRNGSEARDGGTQSADAASRPERLPCTAGTTGD